VLVCSTLPALATPGGNPGLPAAAAELRAARSPAPSARPRPRAPAAAPAPRRRSNHPAPPAPERALLAPSSLYARRTRRLVQSYLRLKLYEMREADLERARKVVERKLGIKALLGETPAPNAR